MRAAAKTRRVGATAAILAWSLAAATSAGAQTAAQGGAPGSATGRDVVNGQVQLGDVFAGQTINVVSADGVVNQATAVGNAASATAAGGGLSFTSRQAVSGSVETNATSTITGASAYAGLTSSATGNAATAAACCGALSGSSVQSAGDRPITAGGFLTVAGDAGRISADTTAVGNTQGWIVQNGSVAQSTTQTLTGSVYANTEADAGRVAGAAGASATAIGNDVTLQGTASSVEGVTRQTTTGGAVKAYLTSQQQAGDGIAGQATASGNNVTVVNSGAYTTNDHAQSNAAAVTADAAYGIANWNAASVGAYGVGNSVLVSSAAPTTAIGVDQTNEGAVTAQSSLRTAGSGGDAYVNATAVGNAAQGYACATCDGGVGVNGSQVNGGAVKAVGVYRGSYGGVVTGAASAVGNTATYAVKGSGG